MVCLSVAVNGPRISKVDGNNCRIHTGGSPEVEVIENVGITAGKVWQTLNEDGPQTLTELKKKVNGSAELVGFALGWLAREDKIDISKEKKTFKVSLK